MPSSHNDKLDRINDIREHNLQHENTRSFGNNTLNKAQYNTNTPNETGTTNNDNNNNNNTSYNKTTPESTVDKTRLKKTL